MGTNICVTPVQPVTNYDTQVKNGGVLMEQFNIEDEASDKVLANLILKEHDFIERCRIRTSSFHIWLGN